jgi:acyl carrier protein
MSLRDDQLLDIVRSELLTLGTVEVVRERISPTSLLIDDLGLDSLKFVDLTVGLEEALGIEEFPMQDWVDKQLEAKRPLDVAGLVEACRGALACARAAQ